MNAAYIALAVFGLYFLAYKFYARIFARQLDIDDKRPTPAHTEYDGADYVPAVFMLVTTTGALGFKIREYAISGQNMLLSIAVMLLLLALFVLYEALRHVRKSYA